MILLYNDVDLSSSYGLATSLLFFDNNQHADSLSFVNLLTPLQDDQIGHMTHI